MRPLRQHLSPNILTDYFTNIAPVAASKYWNTVPDAPSMTKTEKILEELSSKLLLSQCMPTNNRDISKTFLKSSMEIRPEKSWQKASPWMHTTWRPTDGSDAKHFPFAARLENSSSAFISYRTRRLQLRVHVNSVRMVRIKHRFAPRNTAARTDNRIPLCTLELTKWSTDRTTLGLSL